MNLTRIAALPGTGAGIMAALQLEQEPPKPRAPQAPKPAAPSMAHLDVDPALVALSKKRFTAAKERKPLNIADYLESRPFYDPGHSHDARIWMVPHSQECEAVNLRLSAVQAQYVASMPPELVAQLMGDAASEMAQLMQCVTEIENQPPRRR